MNLKTLCNYINECVHEADPNMGDVYYGDAYVLNHMQNVEFPAVVVMSDTHRGRLHDGFMTFRLNIFYVDRLLDDETNKLDIHAVGINFINAVINRVDERFYVENYTIKCFN